MEIQPWGKTAQGQQARLFTLRNAAGATAQITDYGAYWTAFRLPENGALRDCVLGFESLGDYERQTFSMGALVGRYCNRIANGRFCLNGKTYRLPQNNGQNCLHGGEKGFDRHLWRAQAFESPQGEGVRMELLSPDGDQGFPGNLRARVCYTLLAESPTLRIETEVSCDADTVCALTSHPYFNLSGEPDILRHTLQVDAPFFTPVDENLIPTGELQSVAGTPFDFLQAHALGERIENVDTQLARAGGYDHNFALGGTLGSLRFAARLSAPDGGAQVEVWTTEAGLQVYAGNFLEGGPAGRGGKPYTRRQGVALEAQRFPNSPNTPSFPSALLKAGERRCECTEYRFTPAQAR